VAARPGDPVRGVAADDPDTARFRGPLGPLHRVESVGRSYVEERPRLDSPWLPAGILLVLAAVVVLLRLVVAAHGDVSAFVQAGTQFVDPTKAPHGLAVRSGAGFDGQFYYRLALQPWNMAWSAHGITFDFAYRRQRITYSWLAWVVSGGRSAAVPSVLVGLNVAMLGLLGFVCGAWAKSLGRHALWGLLPAGYFGLVWSLDRDLTEITATTLVVAGILACRHRHFLLAGLALSGAVLARETALLVVAALFVTRVVELVRRRGRVGAPDVAWAAPAIAFVGWQAICAAVYGTLPLTSDRGNAAVPFSGAVHAVVGWIGHPQLTNLLELVQLVVLVVVIVRGLLHLRDSRSSSFEKLAFVFAVLLLAVLSTSVWNNDPRAFRTMVDVFVLGSGVLLGSTSFRPLVITALTWGVWLLAAAVSVRYI